MGTDKLKAPDGAVSPAGRKIGTGPLKLAPAFDEAIRVRRARRAELGPVFDFIQRSAGPLTQREIFEKATGYGYLVAEAQQRIVGTAGVIVANSVVCVRDFAASGAVGSGQAMLALLDAVEAEAGELACEAVILSLPADVAPVESLLGNRHYQRMELDQMKSLWREVAREQFGVAQSLWVCSLRESHR